MVKITRYGQGQCVFCAQKNTGTEAIFTDGLLAGFFCKRHFLQLLEMRQSNAENGVTPEKPQPATR